MYTDFIQYKLAGGISEEQLRTAAADILQTWMSKQEGFISWQINKLANDEGFLDVVQWKSAEAAKKAEVNMSEIPPDSPWYACYDMTSIASKNGVEHFHS